MSIARTQKREKAPAIKLFNKLFFEFVGFFAQHSQTDHGVISVEPVVWNKLQDLDDKWRYFCGAILTNPKKKVKFKLDYLVSEVKDHIDRVKMNELHKYLDKYMNTIEIPESDFKVEIPSEMEEMTQKQFVGYAAEMAKLFAGEQNIDDFKTSLVFKFLDIKHNRSKYHKLSELAKLKIADNVFRVAELLDFFFNIEGEKVNVNLCWTKNFIRKITWLLHGPSNALTDISFLEYKDANTFYREYTADKNEGSLNKLVAVLYRPKFLFWKWKYKPGWFFEQRVKRMPNIPFAKRFGVYLFMMACEQFLHSGTFKADGTDINLKLLYEQTLKEKQLQKKQKYTSDTGLTGLAYSLAKTGIYGNIEKVFSQNLYDVLVLLYQQRIEYLNQLENIK